MSRKHSMHKTEIRPQVAEEVESEVNAELQTCHPTRQCELVAVANTACSVRSARSARLSGSSSHELHAPCEGCLRVLARCKTCLRTCRWIGDARRERASEVQAYMLTSCPCVLVLLRSSGPASRSDPCSCLHSCLLLSCRRPSCRQCMRAHARGRGCGC